MELPSNEYKKIGSQRSKFLNLGLPIQKPKVVIVKEYDSAEKGPSSIRRLSSQSEHKVRIVVHTPHAVIHSGEQQEEGEDQFYEAKEEGGKNK